LNEILQDLKFGLRNLLKSPGFALIALSTIGVAIGANAAIFSFVDGILLKRLPYEEPDRIVRVLEKPPGGGRNGISTLNYEPEHGVSIHRGAVLGDRIPDGCREPGADPVRAGVGAFLGHLRGKPRPR
jgi:hypothetical protein